MIPNYQNRQVNSSGVADSNAFGISRFDEAHIMNILRDTLYSDKVLAILREYSSNAWDAHRESGKKDLPIKVVLPTNLDPTLTIQDFGNGISHDDMFVVYTQYGASTKRNSDDAVGMLGIGSKSGFAYSDSFTISSCHGGKRRIYVAVLDETEKGTINLLHEEDCGTDTGVTIQIPVKPEDIPEFIRKARDLFQYFEPRPDINTELPEPPADWMVLENGTLETEREHFKKNYTWMARMGCVAYRVNIDQLRGSGAPGKGLGDHITHLSGVLNFKIGELQVSASREELKYSEMTKKALIAKFDALIDEYVKNTIDAIENNQKFSKWERRIRAQILNQLHLPVPKEFENLTNRTVPVRKKLADIKSFIIHGVGAVPPYSNIEEIYVNSDTKIYINDSTRRLAGYRDLRSHHYILRETAGDHDPQELNKFLIDADILGIPVLKISTLPWIDPTPPKKEREVNYKHLVRTFQFTGNHFYYPYSDAWEVKKREPKDTDVFTILSKFQSQGHNIYTDYRQDQALAKSFDVELPPIYGYKTTAKDPLDKTKCKGIFYADWRIGFVKSLLTPKVKKQLEIYDWSDVVDSYYFNEARLDKIKAVLGKDHVICRFLRQHLVAKKKFPKMAQKVRSSIDTLSDRLQEIEPPAVPASKATLSEILAKYPLIALHHTKLNVLWDSNKAIHFWEYIQLVDRVNPTLTPVTDKIDEESIFDE